MAAQVTLYAHQEEAILEIMEGRHVVLNTPTGSGKSLVATAMHFLFLVSHQVGPVPLSMHNILDLGASHRFAKVVLGLNGGIDGIALQDALLLRRHAHFILRLFVFLYIEAAAHSITRATLTGH